MHVVLLSALLNNLHGWWADFILASWVACHPQLYELQRQRRQGEVDRAKREAAEASLHALDQRIESFNATLKMPCFFSMDA